MPDESAEERTGWWGRIRGTVVAVGAVAAALVAIIALGRELIPDSPPRQGARIEPREVDRPVPLDEFLARTGRASSPASGRGGSFVLAAAGLGQVGGSGEQEGPSEDGQKQLPGGGQEECSEEGSPPPAGGAPVPCPTDEPDPPSEAPPPGSPRDQTQPGDEGEGRSGDERGRRRAEGESRSGDTRGRRRAERPTSIEDFLRDVEPIIKAVKLPDRDESSSETRTEARAKEALTGDRRASDGAVRRVLAGTRLRLVTKAEAADTARSVRTRPVFSIERLPPGERERLEPRGAVVNFDVELEGYEGRSAELRWSLFDARRRSRVRKPWLVDRLALRLTPDAPVDRATSEIWVPLPKKVKGPFFARLEVFDDKGVRVAYEESRTFR